MSFPGKLLDGGSGFAIGFAYGSGVIVLRARAILLDERTDLRSYRLKTKEKIVSEIKLVILSVAKTTQKASVAKMSLLIFITEPKSWGFSPIQ